MTEAPLTKAHCLEACKLYVALGLEYTLLPLYSTTHHSNIWRSKVETDQLNDVYNIGVRGGQNVFGGLTSFAITVEEDLNFRTPLCEVPAYQFLRDLGTLRFEAGTSASFLFKCDKFISVSEQRNGERIFPDPLKGARLIYETGMVGFGVVRDAYGRSVVVTSECEPQDVRKYPVLVDALRKTGRVQVSVASPYVATAISGPPLL